MKTEYTKGTGDSKAYGFWVKLQEKIQKNQNLFFKTEELSRKWSQLLAEFNKHQDVLEKDTGTPDHKEYWKGKHSKTENMYYALLNI